MSRPRKFRNIKYIPNITEFVPLGSLSNEIIQLNVDELEAIRLMDLERLQQEESANQMGISRGTFQRILSSARNKVAESIVNGKRIIISGGDYKIEECLHICRGYMKDSNDNFPSDGFRRNQRRIKNSHKGFCREICNFSNEE